MKKLLVTNISEKELTNEHWEKLKDVFNEIVFKLADDKSLLDELEDTEAIFSKFNIIDSEIINNAPNLKYIGVFATGYGKVDLDLAKEKGIVVTNVPGYSTESVAEFTIAIILEHLRELSRAKQQASNGDYSEAGFSAKEIKGKKFGIIGLGKIGKRVAELANAFGADVRYWSRSNKDISIAKVEELEELIQNSDILSLHLALNDHTQNIIDTQKIKKIKPGAIVINTAPMEILELEALLQRLKQKDITFIWDHSDEMAEEVLAKITRFDNCITYPPIGYITDESSRAKQDIFVENIEAFLEGTNLNVVN